MTILICVETCLGQSPGLISLIFRPRQFLRNYMLDYHQAVVVAVRVRQREPSLLCESTIYTCHQRKVYGILVHIVGAYALDHKTTILGWKQRTDVPVWLLQSPEKEKKIYFKYSQNIINHIFTNYKLGESCVILVLVNDVLHLVNNQFFSYINYSDNKWDHVMYIFRFMSTCTTTRPASASLLK